jgi:hypothetical protein
LFIIRGKTRGKENIYKVVYYESINREIQTRPIYECRCDERLKTKDEESTPLAYAAARVKDKMYI